MNGECEYTCPHCGEAISGSAAACPHCGSDERTGWSESTYLDGIDYGESIEYEEIRRGEFEGNDRMHLHLWQIVTGALLVVMFLYAIIRSVI